MQLNNCCVKQSFSSVGTPKDMLSFLNFYFNDLLILNVTDDNGKKHDKKCNS